jgi:hypothetical protein
MHKPFFEDRIWLSNINMRFLAIPLAVVNKNDI